MHDSWHSYPKVHALGHAAVADLLLDPVTVEEKVDGSQFSFGKFISQDGVPYLRTRSRGGELNVDAPERMFEAGIAAVRAMFADLHPEWSYRGEYLAKPKHNTLAYARVPARHVIIFDVSTGMEKYMPYPEKHQEGTRLGLEVVPLLHEGKIESLDFFRTLLDRTSVLGGQKIEGVVVKNYARFGRDGKALMGKFVSEAFKEIHGQDWKERNPKQGDILQILVSKYRTPARWAKAVQHLREAGLIEDAPQDIGKLIKAARADVLDECGVEIKDALFAWAWPHVQRGITGGLPEWYKEELLKKQFEHGTGDAQVVVPAVALDLLHPDPADAQLPVGAGMAAGGGDHCDAVAVPAGPETSGVDTADVPADLGGVD